jgi:hypothetical protein
VRVKADGLLHRFECRDSLEDDTQSVLDHLGSSTAAVHVLGKPSPNACESRAGRYQRCGGEAAARRLDRPSRQLLAHSSLPLQRAVLRLLQHHLGNSKQRARVMTIRIPLPRPSRRLAQGASAA